MSCFSAGQDENVCSLSCLHMQAFTVFWCRNLHNDEWKETNLGLSYMWSTSWIQQAFYWWVSHIRWKYMILSAISDDMLSGSLSCWMFHRKCWITCKRIGFWKIHYLMTEHNLIHKSIDKLYVSLETCQHLLDLVVQHADCWNLTGLKPQGDTLTWMYLNLWSRILYIFHYMWETDTTLFTA